jgi:S-adenosylmethionine synthetase
MKNNSYQFTSESVSAGHPDKVADQISDAILDAYLSQDPNAKVACECLITTQHLCIAGEVTSNAKVNAEEIARDVLAKIGYDNDEYGFNLNTAKYEVLLHQQSPEIFNSVDDGGAGDQGIMFGYACDETPEFMPLAITLAHKLVKRQNDLRDDKALDWLLPDAKSQVTINYRNGVPEYVDTIVLSTQHKSGIQLEDLRKAVLSNIIEPVIGEWLSIKTPIYLINPSGSFTIGGPHGDTGLTGRKIIVDTYGGSCPHGGGAFSGKDPSKVDRSAAYAARYIAKHLVASGVMSKCVVQLSYAIGVSEPTSIYIDDYGTSQVELSKVVAAVYNLFPLTPKQIISKLDLLKPIYSQTASYGHFGNATLPWERIDQSIIQNLKMV